MYPGPRTRYPARRRQHRLWPELAQTLEPLYSLRRTRISRWRLRPPSVALISTIFSPIREFEPQRSALWSMCRYLTGADGSSFRPSNNLTVAVDHGGPDSKCSSSANSTCGQVARSRVRGRPTNPSRLASGPRRHEGRRRDAARGPQGLSSMYALVTGRGLSISSMLAAAPRFGDHSTRCFRSRLFPITAIQAG